MNHTTRRYPRKRIDVQPGDKYGELVVVKEQPRKRKKSGAPFRVFEVLCSCGVVKDVALASMREGTTVSCGHIHREKASDLGRSKAIHGKTNTPIHTLWRAMIQRCHNPKNKSYARYGAKGVAVCDEWRSNFQAFADYMGERPDGMTLDRINSRGNYEPGNVRWATHKQQARNTSRNRMIEVDGVVKCAAEWCEETGIGWDKARYELRMGRNPFTAQPPNSMEPKQ